MAVAFRSARAWMLAICGCSSCSATSGDSVSGSETGSSTDASATTTGGSTSAGTEGTTGSETTMVATSDASGSDSGDSTTTSSSSDASADEVTSSESGAACPEDEPQHTTPNSALDLPGVDCDDPPQAAATILDEATGLDWWTFDGTDPDGGCEPDSARVAVTGGGPVNVCMFTTGCDATCVQGTPDGPAGCCGLDVVELQISCARGDTDDSTRINILLSDGGVEHCRDVAFEYEF